ncbi:MAG: PEP-CTERM sorting domain-containing protein [Planctomycetota bacterium]
MKSFTNLYTACMAFTLFATATSASAQVYEFVERGSGDVLAFLEFSNLPTNDAADIVGLTFSPEGQTAFGYGPDTTITFTSIAQDGVQDNGDGNLGTVTDASLLAIIISSNAPPPSSLATSGLITDAFDIVIGNDNGGADILRLELSSTGSAGGAIFIEEIEAEGDFVLVPEPSSLALLSLASLVALTRQRRNA